MTTKLGGNPVQRLPDWRTTLPLAQSCPRCGARTRAGTTCRSPAMPNGRCRMHGGASTGARTAEGMERAKTARLKHGRRAAPAREAARKRGEAKRIVAELLRLVAQVETP